MKQSFSYRERLLLSLVVLLSGLLFFGGKGVSFSDAEVTGDSTELFDQLKVFTDVLALVRRDYVREVDSGEIVKGAIKGMLTTLDPHSSYLDPEFYQDLQVQTRGEFGGLGIEITIRDGLLVVVAPMEGSPAEQAGVKPGDAIVKIEGKFTKDFSLVDAVKQLRGPKGTPVTISVARKGTSELIDITIVRDRISVKSVRWRSLDNGFGYVRLSQFVETSYDDLKAALHNIENASRTKSIRGLILDLRNDPGGLLTQAVKIGDLFLKDGVIVYTDGRIEDQKQRFFAHEEGTQADYPMVVLVNGGSASASEIVAGALQDAGRALIMGTQTFGKGSVQTITPLPNGGALTLTTALYFTRSGRSIQQTGVEPDIIFEEPLPPALEEAGEASQKKHKSLLLREGDLPGAIDNPNGRAPLRRLNKTPKVPTVSDETTKPEDLPVAEFLRRDPIVEHALELLKSFSIFGREKRQSFVDEARAASGAS